MKEAETQSTSQRSCFDALTSYAKKQGASIKSLPSDSRTLYNEVSSDVLTQFVGVHRIQRQPKTDKKGRRHTSTVTVALIDPKDNLVVEIDEKDLQETFTRGSGPGGQHKNKNDTCVVLVHKPTGIRVRADGKSQANNRKTARSELLRRLSLHRGAAVHESLNGERVLQVDGGGRNAKSFTHNAQRDQTVDHSTGRKWRMKDFMKGKM